MACPSMLCFLRVPGRVSCQSRIKQPSGPSPSRPAQQKIAAFHSFNSPARFSIGDATQRVPLRTYTYACAREEVLFSARLPRIGTYVHVREAFAQQIVARRHVRGGPWGMGERVEIAPVSPPDALPDLLDADEMSVIALGGQNVWAAFLARQLGRREDGRPERHRLRDHRYGAGEPSPRHFRAEIGTGQGQIDKPSRHNHRGWSP
jgi:hypothetical protein